MDLYNIDEVICPDDEAGVPALGPEDAFLGGGTWLYSTPQPHIRRLVDLTRLPLPPIELDETSLTIAANCPLGTLLAWPDKAAWPGFSLLESAVRALSSSFKVWAVATLSGNVCLALNKCTTAPALCLLGAEYELRLGEETRWVPANGFQTDHLQTILRPGEWMRRIRIPLKNLLGSGALRGLGLTEQSHVVALGAVYRLGDEVRLAVSAATGRPVVLFLHETVTWAEAESDLREAVTMAPAFGDCHGSEEYRREMAFYLLRECWEELS